VSSYLWSAAQCGGSFVSRKAAQEPRDRTSYQSGSSDSRERCAGKDAIIIRGAWKLGEGRSSEVEDAKSYTNLRAAERRCFRFLRAPGFACPTLTCDSRAAEITGNATGRVEVRQSTAGLSLQTPTHATRLNIFSEHTRRRSQDGGGRPWADLWRCALHDHPQRRTRR